MTRSELHKIMVKPGNYTFYYKEETLIKSLSYRDIEWYCTNKNVNQEVHLAIKDLIKVEPGPKQWARANNGILEVGDEVVVETYAQLAKGTVTHFTDMSVMMSTSYLDCGLSRQVGKHISKNKIYILKKANGNT